jgi:hypothetical protein
MPVKSDEDNAKLAYRQLRRQQDVDIPASDVEELVVYVEEAYELLKDRTSPLFDPRTYARRLAEKAARAYAKMEYTGIARYENQYERAAERWGNEAATAYHRDDLATNPHETIADRQRRKIAESHPRNPDTL